MCKSIGKNLQRRFLMTAPLASPGPRASRPALIDAHCHIHDPRFQQQQQQEGGALQTVIARAKAANVTHIVSCACFEDDWSALDTVLSTWEYYSKSGSDGAIGLTPSFGVHPWWANSRRDDYLELLRAKLMQHPNAMLGEIGLCKTARGRLVDRETQERVFYEQLELATELSRACVIHCVGYYGKLLELLQKLVKATHKLPPKIVLHSYGGGAEMVASFLALEQKVTPHTQIYFSLNAKQLADTRSDKAASCCASIPLRALLLETDAPDQTPPPEVLQQHADADGAMGFSVEDSLATTSLQLNEPAFVKIAYIRAAEIRKLSLEELAAQAHKNARTAFGFE
ncbi:Tatd related dnase, partial [Globisporangium splendens]